MNYGLYMSAGGMLTSMHRQDVAANNLANASATGFKRDLASFAHRLPESIEGGFGPDAAHALLDRLGGGVMTNPTRIDASPGALTPTGNDLDLGIEGSGFFVVRPEGGEDGPRLTRDGRLTLGADGRLITTAGGHELLDEDGQPIVLDPAARTEIDEHGAIVQGGLFVGRIGLIDAADPSLANHVGEGLYEDERAVAERRPAGGFIRQGFVEQSNVNPIAEMLELIEASRAIQTHGTLIGYHDQVMDRAANVLGRVA